IDIGGQSTRPGSERVSAEKETERVVKLISVLHANFPDLIISVDTYYASVAKAAVYAGASVVNDISGGMMDANMLDTVAALRVPFICTHMKGTPDTMQIDPVYEDVTLEVLDFFIHQVKLCNRAGIMDVIIDPGIGFGKTIAHNFELIEKLERFSILDNPLLLGVSRKGSIYKTLGTDAAGALNGTTVLNTIGLMKGAAILRVHDVKEAMEAVKLVSAVNRK
ncbi:MAG: dihydropteroate synthase, partial [Flavitalea sp.]